MSDIIQLKITLGWTKPPIWRRVLLEKTTTFEQLHYIIQIAMGWSNSHLHEFNLNGSRIAEPNEFVMDGWEEEIIDSSTVTLDGMLRQDAPGKFSYTYDFGDNWEHQLVVEKWLPRDAQTRYPVCVGGRLNTPPEDCGGIPGFYHLLEVMGNKKHPERKELQEWLGGAYDPAFFDKEAVNQQLASLDGYRQSFRGLY